MDTALASLTSEAPANLVLTLIIVPILQWLKRTNWPVLAWINERSVFVISGAVALFAALGIHFTYDPSADIGTISWSGAGILAGVAEWTKQFALQHWGHRALRAFEVMPKALEALASIKELTRKD